MANSATDPTVFGTVLRCSSMDIIIGKITKASAVGTWWGVDSKATRCSYRNIFRVAQFGDPDDKEFNRRIITRKVFSNEVLTVEEA